MMNHYLQVMTEARTCVEIYWSGSRDEHIKLVQQAFEIQKKAELVVKLSKC